MGNSSTVIFKKSEYLIQLQDIKLWQKDGKTEIEYYYKDEDNIDLYTLLCGYDLNEDGVLEKNELKFALDKISQLNNNQFEALINLFNLGDKINIKDFISLFNMEFVNKLSF